MKEQGRTEDIFEREWREAFDGVEQAPPRIVWSDIDRTLAHEKALIYKKKSIYYRWAAAAIFLLATSIGLLQLTGSQNGVMKTIAGIDIDNPQQIVSVLDLQLPERVGSFKGGDAEPPKQNIFLASSQDGKRNDSKLLSSIPQEEKNGEEIQLAGFGDIAILELDGIDPQLNISESELVDHLYKRPSTYMIYSEKQKPSSLDDKYWAGVDFSSGSFDPNYQSSAGSLVDESLSFNTATQFSAFNTESLDSGSPTVRESMQSGQSLSFGFNMGMQLSSRWSLQSGFQYMKAHATNTTNVVVASNALIDPIAVTSQIKNVSQVRQVLQAEEIVEYNYQDVDFNNEFQFATIPVNAGYKLIDSRFSVEVKAGLAANLYLGNKLTDPDNQIADVTIGPGRNSPYKEVSFIGLAGLQFGYEFINRFNFIIEPNYRRSLDNMTKSGSEFVAAPSGFGLQTGIRYEFN